MADNVIEENVIDKIQVKEKEYYFGIKYDSQRNIINETYFRRDEMPQIEQAVTGAENVNATITEENIFEVTDRNGITKTLDLNTTGGTPGGSVNIESIPDDYINALDESLQNNHQ